MKSNNFTKKALFRNVGILFFLLLFVSFGGSALADAERSKRIIGGRESTPGAWPWMVAIVESGMNPKDGQDCAGTLIHPKWVVTAAHCGCDSDGRKISADKAEVVAGLHYLGDDTGQRVRVRQIILHPSYDYDRDDSDIALFELETEITGLETLPIHSGGSLDGMTGTVIGWGNTRRFGKSSDTLQEVELPIVSNDVCASAHADGGYCFDCITDTMLCAGFTDEEKDACAGDSGGPLMVRQYGKWILAGIVSWGFGCAEADIYGVFTRASVFSDWITRYVPAATAAVAQERLIFPHVASSGPWETEIAIINRSDSAVSGILKSFEETGKELVSHRIAINLPPRGRTEMIVGELPGNRMPPLDTSLIRYMTVDSASNAFQGYLKFFRKGVYRVAVPAATESNADDLHLSHIASNDEWWTGISLVNRNNTPRTVSIRFNTGDMKTVSLNPGEHRAFTVRELFDSSLPETLASAKISNTRGITGLMLLGSSDSSKKYYLSGISLSGDTASTICYPHVASNKEWWTGLVACNPNNERVSLTITAFSETGMAVITPAFISLDPGEKYIGTAAGLGLPADTAWFRVQSTQPVSGFELFGTQDGRALAGYSGINIKRRTGIFPKRESTGGWTGIAFVNLGNQTADIGLYAYDNSGVLVDTATISLGSYAKRVDVAENLFDTSIASADYIRFSSTQEIVGFQLNGSADGLELDGLAALSAD